MNRLAVALLSLMALVAGAAAHRAVQAGDAKVPPAPRDAGSYALRVGDGAVVRLGGPESVAVLSPDGTMAAVATRQPPGAGLRIVEPATGRESIALASDEGSADNPVWSPDGRLLAFQFGRFGRPDPAAVPPSGLYIVDPRTRETVRVLRDTPVIWIWGPDSRSITSMTFDFSGETTTYSIVDVDVFSGEVRRTLLEPTASLCPSAFAWSQDARQFVFASGVYRQGCGDPDLFGLWLVDPAGGEPQRLTSGALTILPRWTADGRIVARRIGGFDVAERGAGPGPDSIVLIGTDGSERRLAQVERALFPSWPYLEVAGGVAAFGSGGCARGSVSSVGIAGGAPRRLSDQAVATLTPALAPDGRAVAWVAEHDGGADLVLAATDGSGERALLTGALPIDLNGWSGDGRWLSFTVREGPLASEGCPA